VQGVLEWWEEEEEQMIDEKIVREDAATPRPLMIHPHMAHREYDARGYGVGPALPWFIVPATDAGKSIGGARDSALDKSAYAQAICNLDIGKRHRSDAELHANAALIVSAVNAHDLACKLVQHILADTDGECCATAKNLAREFNRAAGRDNGGK
jgi:hypothetical protein